MGKLFLLPCLLTSVILAGLANANKARKINKRQRSEGKKQQKHCYLRGLHTKFKRVYRL